MSFFGLRSFEILCGIIMGHVVVTLLGDV